MRVLLMNDDHRFDVDMKQLQVKVEDNNPFSDRELPSINLFNAIISSKIEMKSHMQTLKTGNLFLEFEIDNRGNGVLDKSGLSTTEADFWFLNIGDMAIFLSYPFMKWMLDNRKRLKIEVKTNHKTAKDHIGHGLIIPMYRLMEIYMEYNNHLIKQRIAEVMKNKK